MSQTLYHVTPAYNYQGILLFGLMPQLGERARELDTETRGIFLFPTRDLLEDALGSWLGEAFAAEAEPLIVLELELPDNWQLDQDVEWEKISRTAIPAAFIRSVSTPLPADPPVHRGKTATGDNWICGMAYQLDNYTVISQPNGPIIVQRSSLEPVTGGRS